MSRPPPHARVLFELTASREDGVAGRVFSGYRPTYDIRPDYWTSVHHEFASDVGVSTGESAVADVWFITPEVYPHSLWPGRVLAVAEGHRIVGKATVQQVFRQSLATVDRDPAAGGSR